MAYFHDLEKEPGESPILRQLATWAYKNTNWMYNHRGLAIHKEHMKVNRLTKLYVCQRGPISKLVCTIIPFNAAGMLPFWSAVWFGRGTFKHSHDTSALSSFEVKESLDGGLELVSQ